MFIGSRQDLVGICQVDQFTKYDRINKGKADINSRQRKYKYHEPPVGLQVLKKYFHVKISKNWSTNIRISRRPVGKVIV